MKNMKGHLFATCSVCGHRVGYFTDNQQKTVGQLASYAGASAGLNFEQLFKFFSMMSVKFMTRKTWDRNLSGCSELWSSTLKRIMEQNCEEEAQLAIAAGDVGADNVPEISAIADGVYSKKCNGTYNARSCVTSVFGGRKRQLIDLRFANKYCVVCTKAGRKKVAPKPHQCFKTSGDGSEAGLIAESFRESQKNLKVRFKQLVADNDTATYKRVLRRCGYSVQKADCVEHTIRIVRKNVFKVESIIMQ
jgi:hypothetical protein